MDNRNEGFCEAINKNRDFMKFPNLETFTKIQNNIKSDQTKNMQPPPLENIK